VHATGLLSLLVVLVCEMALLYLLPPHTTSAHQRVRLHARRFVPASYQVLFANMVALVWNVYFSFATRPKTA
jgi:hypothetical protein